MAVNDNHDAAAELSALAREASAGASGEGSKPGVTGGKVRLDKPKAKKAEKARAGDADVDGLGFDLGSVFAPAAGVVGNLICRRAGVRPLDAEECEAVGVALAEVARHYNFTMANPKVAAWIGLALTVGGIVSNRAGELAARPAPAAAEAPAQAASFPDVVAEA